MPTNEQLTAIWSELARAQYAILCAIELTEDTHAVSDLIADCEGHIEVASAVLSNLTPNHTH